MPDIIAAGALKGAVIGAATGAVIGAGTGAINHRRQTGSWQGAGKAALEGGANGFMTGAITGGVTGAASNAIRVGRAASNWGSTAEKTSFQNMSSHYGKHVVEEGHTYLGNNYDSELGFYYLQSRYYDPVTMRFLNADGFVSTGQGLLGTNMFAYCGNNPINRYDPNGYQWFIEWSRDLAKYAQAAAGKTIPPTISLSSIFNHVTKTHTTTPEAMIDGGILFGKIGFSTTVTTNIDNKKPALFSSYSDTSDSGDTSSVGLSISDWLELGVGYHKDNVFVELQVTPLIHSSASISWDGIGATVGWVWKNTSYDFEIKLGWGLATMVFAGWVAGSAGGGQPAQVPA